MYPNASASVCLSQSCIQASADIYSRLSPNFQNIDPCTNFAELVCGGLQERNVIPPWEKQYGELTTMRETNNIFMKNILEASSSPSWVCPGSTDEKNFLKLVAGYNACMNETLIAERGVQPLVTFLGNVTENFPVTAEGYKSPTPFSPEDHKSFSQTYLYFAEHGIFPFLSISVNLDPDYPETYIPIIAPSSASLPSSLYEEEETVSAYEKAVTEVFAAMLPTDESKAAAEELAHGLVELERKIASTAPTLTAKDILEMTTLDNATQIAPEFDFSSVFQAISPSPVNRTSYPFRDYSVWLSETLANTTTSTIQAFFMWQAINAYELSVDGPELQPLREFKNIVDGNKPGYVQERWRTCISDVDSKMPWLFSKPYIEAKYTDAIKKTLQEMTTRIQHRLANNIDHIDWMTDKVKAIAKHKVEVINQKLGYPTQSPNLDDAESLRDYYADFDVSDSYFDNTLSYSKWLTKTTASLIGTKRENNSWPAEAGSSMTINAFYLPQENSIIITAGTLQQLFIDPNLPAYMNYGALGTVIGHEFTHSLDSSGREYDERGAFRNWWDAESSAGFAERARCLVDQFDASRITLSDGRRLPVNGTQTLGENIADTGGVNTAWDAWQDKRREDPAADFDLPGLRDVFSHEQLFYVAAAEFFCRKADDAVKQLLLETDEHSPAEIRIQNMMDNSEGFRRAFNCPVKKPTCVIY